MFKFDEASAAEIIAEEAALATLRSYSIAEVLAVVEDRQDIVTEEDAFNALMSAMYQLRPVGHV